MVVNKFLKSKNTESFWGHMFIMPAVLIITIFIIFPATWSIYYSLFKYDGIREATFIGINNYIKFFIDDPLALNSLKIAVYYIFGTLPPALIIGLTIALILNKKWFKGAGFVSAIYFIPFVMSFIGVAYIWRWMLDPASGLINWFLSLVNIQGPKWLSTPGLALFCIFFISVWKNIGFFIILYSSSLKSLPTAYLEAAEIDGTNEWQKVRYIILPLLLPTTIFLTIVSSIDAFKVFEQVYALTSGGPNNTTRIVAYYVWQVGFTDMRMGYSSAIATILLIIMLILTFIQWKYYTSKTQYLEQ